jgi:hypothetical protein
MLINITADEAHIAYTYLREVYSDFDAELNEHDDDNSDVTAALKAELATLNSLLNKLATVK